MLCPPKGAVYPSVLFLLLLFACFAFSLYSCLVLRPRRIRRLCWPGCARGGTTTGDFECGSGGSGAAGG